MIITLGGRHGSGKSTIAIPLAKKLGFKHYSAGDFLRQMAKEKKIPLLEMVELAKKDPSINEEIDKRTEALGKKEDNFIIDGLLAFHFIPRSYKIFFDITLQEAARRIYTNRRSEEKNLSPKHAEDNLRQRVELERRQFLEQYDLDPYDPTNYDWVIDTTNLSQEEVLEKVYNHLLVVLNDASK